MSDDRGDTDDDFQVNQGPSEPVNVPYTHPPIS